MTKLVLDVMGGDHAPTAALDGVSESLAHDVAVLDELILVGDETVIGPELATRGLERARVVHAPDRIESGDTPVDALRKKPRNSIAVGVELVKNGEADGFISAGNTGLVVATATLGLRCLEGVRRPGIAVTIKGERGPFIVIDVGANPQPKAAHLAEYAIMGGAYSHDAFDVERPRIGVLNIGSEDAKGNPLVREARPLIEQAAKAAGHDYVGNVEGVEVFAGAADVIVTDGFTGNVLLKVSEGVAEYLLRAMMPFMAEAGIDENAIRRVLARAQQDVDFAEYGGALLLGVEGIVTICHGRSGPNAFRNAIRFAKKAVSARVNEHIVLATRAVQESS